MSLSIKRSIRTKIMVLVSIVMIGLLSLIFIISNSVYSASFDKLEKDQTLERVGIMENALLNEVHAIYTSTRDYATWNDTYLFMIDQNQTYVDTNLDAETYKNLGMNFIILVNTDGIVVLGKEYNRTTQMLDPLPSGMSVHIGLDGMIVSSCVAGNETTGLMMVDGRPVLFAARPILTSEGQGPSEGAFIMGRTIDRVVLSRFENSTGLPMRLYGTNDPNLTAELGEVASNELINDHRTMHALNESVMGGYILVEDLNGNDGVVIRISVERVIHAQSITSLHNLVIFLTIASLVFGIVTILLLERTVISRLSNLRKEVSRIDPNSTSELKVSSKGQDEIGGLADNINEMLVTIDTAQKKLMESEGRYRGIVEDQNELIARFDSDLRVTFMNGTFLKTINMDWEKVKGMRIDQLMRPGFVDMIKDHVDKLDADAPISTFESMMMSPAGGIWVRTSVRAILDNAGKIVEYQTVGADITERKRAEEALQSSKKALADIIDFLPDATFVVDLEGRVVAWNQAMERMSGVSRIDMIGQGDHAFSIPFYGARRNQLLDLLTLDDEEIRKKYDYVTRIGGSLYAEAFCNALNDGKGAYVWATATSIFDDQGNRVGAIESIRDITERKQAEDAMKESVRRYELVMDGSSAGLWDSDVANKRIHFSPHWKAMRGYTDAEIGDSETEWTSRIHPDDAARVKAAMQAHFEGKTDVFEAEYRVRRKDGSFIWVLDRGKVVRDASGKVIRNVGSEIDVTEHKRAEEALRESENRFEQLAEQSGTVVWEIDADGLYIYVGHASEAVLGYRPDELVGKKHFYDLIPKAEAESLKRIIFSTFKNRERFVDFENAMQTKDGRVVWVSTNGIPLLNADGTLRGYQGSDRDITERKLAEEALKQSEARIRTYFESSPEGIFILDAMGNFQDVNSPGCAKLGYSREEMLTLNIVSVVDKAETQVVLDVFMSLKEKGLAAVESVMVTKDGVRVPSFLNAVELPGHRYMAFATDITERKRAEEALHQANNKLSILNTVTRHDINNQMMVLNGFLELSKSRNKDPDLAHYFDKMSAAAANLQSQIAFTKNYQELGIKAPTWASVSKRIAEAFAMLNPPGVVLEDGTAGLEVLTDPLADKVQYNLIDNSMRHGGHITRIRMSAEQVGDAMLIAYEDDGVGISVEDKKRLFEKGFGKNTGYGLFLIREILAITGITITERGQPGKGVRFEMLVPPGAWRFNPPR